MKESAKPVMERLKRRKVDVFAFPPNRGEQQQEEQKNEEPGDQEMHGDQPQPNPFNQGRRKKKEAN